MSFILVCLQGNVPQSQENEWLKASGSLRFTPTGAEMYKWWETVKSKKHIHKRYTRNPSKGRKSLPMILNVASIYAHQTWVQKVQYGLPSICTFLLPHTRQRHIIIEALSLNFAFRMTRTFGELPKGFTQGTEESPKPNHTTIPDKLILSQSTQSRPFNTSGQTLRHEFRPAYKKQQQKLAAIAALQWEQYIWRALECPA